MSNDVKFDMKFFAAILLLIIGIVFISFFSYFRPVVEVVDNGFYKIPHKIGEWIGDDHTFSQEVYDELRADENFYRIYKRSDGATLGLYIGYYGTKRGGHPDHVPTGCYPSSGWKIEEIKTLSIALGENTAINVNNLYAVKGERKEQTLYWLQNFLGDVTNNGLGQNLEKIKTKVLYNRNDGAFIRVNSRVITTRKDTIKFQKEFIKLLMPYLKENWPIEK